LRLFVDSYHTGYQFTRRSRTGFVLYVNMAPIVWFSKRPSTVESSVFGAEFVAMKNGIDEEQDLNLSRAPLQVEDFGCHSGWSRVCLWGQTVCCAQ
jgi:hypothetical protein